MECLHCHSKIGDDSRFCSRCGSAVHPAAEGIEFLTKTMITATPGLAKGSLLAGKYEIREEIGHGGMGVVYRAEDLKLKRSVALKFLPSDWTQAAEAKQRFLQEARAAAALSHPYICTIFEVDDGGERPFIAMEFIEGETLRDRVRRGPLPLEEALTLASQIAEGLEAAHGKGIIHRDIKSSNIMVTGRGQAKIMDFGLAKLGDGSSLTREGATVGTAAYMSPEQARGEKVDHRTDLWSWGVVLYEMLSGELPFRGERDVSLLYSIVHEEPRPLTDRKPPLSQDLCRIIGRALAKDPASRFQSAADAQRDIVRVQDERKAEAAGVLSVRSLWRRFKRPVIAIPSFLALAAFFSAAAWFLHHQAKIRQVRTELLPKLTQLVENRSYFLDEIGIYDLAVKIEKLIPDDPKLVQILNDHSFRLFIRTEPAGAKVFIKGYHAPDADWRYIGLSPVEDIRIAPQYLRIRIEKDGYETVLAASLPVKWDEKEKKYVPEELFRRLDKAGEIPAGMVRVTGVKDKNLGQIEDFFIDRFEVTNRRYKEFIDAGGYREKDYWKHAFTKDGKELTWAQALSEFTDGTGRPGPATWQGGDFPEGQDDYPVSGVSWYEAAAYAEFAHKSLPTGNHWGIALGDQTMLFIRKGFAEFFAPQSNFKGKGPERVGLYPAISAYGVSDMAGNAREWCFNKTERGRLIRGGAWADVTYMYGNWSQRPPFDRAAGNSFRCVVYDRPELAAKSVFETVKEPEFPDYYKTKPIPDPVFQAYKNQYSYDKRDLNARLEERFDAEKEWTVEKVSYDAAYENERIVAFLAVPKNISPPYQTVIIFPGSDAALNRSSQGLEKSISKSFIVKNGRALLFPVYKGTFERGNDALTDIHTGTDTYEYTDFFIKVVKDFKKSIDYLETRSDIDHQKLAFIGYSWGGMYGAIIPAVEDRLKASVLRVGGLYTWARPEVDDINYVRRVKIPTLMLNGRYDMTIPYELSAKPMFDLLGTPPDQKELKLYDTDHFIPETEFVKETLKWLDKYLGPVK